MFFPEYVEEHKIEWRWVDNSFGEHNIEERDRQVVATDTMPAHEMKRLWQWVWCIRMGHSLGITHDIANQLVKETNITYKKFYDDWLQYIQTSFNILNEEFIKSNLYLREHKYNHYLFHFDFIE